MIQPHGTSNQVSHLQADRIGRFWDHDVAKRKRLTQSVATIANPAESEFQLCIFFPAATLDDNGSFLVATTNTLQVPVDTLQTRFESVIVWAYGFLVAGDECGFIDHHSYKGHRQICHQSGQFHVKAFPDVTLEKNLKSAGRFSQFVFVQHHFVMSPESNFQLLNLPAYMLNVVVLSEDNKDENENWVICRDILQAVIAAFIDEDEVVRESHRHERIVINRLLVSNLRITGLHQEMKEIA